MTVERVEKRNSPSEERPAENTGNTNLESKLLQIGEMKYFLDMMQTGEHRFFRIVEASLKPRKSRIVVPMVVGGDFCQKIDELVKFASTYVFQTPPKESKERPDYVHTVAITTGGRRRYYFDVIDEGFSLTLKISYVYGDRRDVVVIPVAALSNLLQVLTGFVQNYPSLSEGEDMPPFNSGRRNFGDRQRRGVRQPRAQRSPSSNTATAAASASNTTTTGDGRRTQVLRVLQDPAPAAIDVNVKRFTFEVVEGDNMFLRVTEIINGVRKSTIHVPVEACAQVQSIIGDMSKKLNLSSNGGSLPAGNAVTSVGARA